MCVKVDGLALELRLIKVSSIGKTDDENIQNDDARVCS